MKSRHIGQSKNDNSDFAKMLEQSFEKQTRVQPGKMCSAAVTSIKNSDYIFIRTEFGNGVLHREELVDENGNVRVNPGESISVFYLSNENGENLYTTRPEGRFKKQILQSAFENTVPLPGKVVRSVKGGYEIQIGDSLAFCPFSHMDIPENQVSGTYPFLISELSDKKIIVSRKLLKEKENEIKREAMQNNLREGDVVSGRIASITNFGAFVDIGGMEGLIPVSEMSFQRVQNPRDIFKTGQEVRVKIISLDWKDNKMSLSYKAMLSNPWQGEMPFSEGTQLSGRVESIKNFGLFVTLPDGFTGLVPLSETGLPRGKSPDKEFTVGSDVDVIVKFIDRENEKISLSIKDVQEKISREEYADYLKKEDRQNSGEEISSFGRQLLNSLNKNKPNS